jgi:hypothetical protein
VQFGSVLPNILCTCCVLVFRGAALTTLECVRTPDINTWILCSNSKLVKGFRFTQFVDECGTPEWIRTTDLLLRRQPDSPNSLITEQIFSCKTSTYVPKIPPWVGNWVGGSRETPTPGSLAEGLLLAPVGLSAHASSKRYYTFVARPRSRKIESLIRNSRCHGSMRSRSSKRSTRPL